MKNFIWKHCYNIKYVNDLVWVLLHPMERWYQYKRDRAMWARHNAFFKKHGFRKANGKWVCDLPKE